MCFTENLIDVKEKDGGVEVVIAIILIITDIKVNFFFYMYFVNN